jgi:hypothetical protein
MWLLAISNQLLVLGRSGLTKRRLAFVCCNRRKRMSGVLRKIEKQML